jgi:adenylate cyclase
MYGTSIMVNEAIYEQVQDQVETRKLDLIKVVGKETPVTAYEILDRKGELSPEKCEVLELYKQGMKAYEAFYFSEAQGLFEHALQVDPQDGPASLYADRCKQYATTPLADLVFQA